MFSSYKYVSKVDGEKIVAIEDAFVQQHCVEMSGGSHCSSSDWLIAASCLFFSWDDSSSVSSGLSDTLDNISTDDLNTTSSISSYSNITVPSRKNTQVRAILSLSPLILSISFSISSFVELC